MGPKDKNQDTNKSGDLADKILDRIWENLRDTVSGGYSKDDAAKDTGASREDVNKAWGNATKDGSN